MDIVVAGSHGLIGSELLERLRADGHHVRRLVRRPPQTRDEREWDPDAGILDPAALDGADAVVNLSGAGIGEHRWTVEYKRTLLTSRTRTTGLLARTLAGLDRPVPVLVQGSAIGYYGDRGAQVLTETSSPGTGFLARLVHEWEAATAPAEDAGVRVVHARTGIVLSTEGGAVLRFATGSVGAFDSLLGLTVLAEALVNGLVERRRDAVVDRLDALDRTWTDGGLFTA